MAKQEMDPIINHEDKKALHPFRFPLLIETVVDQSLKQNQKVSRQYTYGNKTPYFNESLSSPGLLNLRVCYFLPFLKHSRPHRLRSIWQAPWIETSGTSLASTSGRLQSVLVTDWSDANTIKIDKPEKKLHHEAWRKGTNKANFCGNVRLPYSQGKYYEEKPSVRFTW